MAVAQAKKGFLGLQLINGTRYNSATKVVTKPTKADLTEITPITGALDFPVTPNEETLPVYGSDDPIVINNGNTEQLTLTLSYDPGNVLQRELQGATGRYKGISSNTIINTDDEAIFAWYPDDTQSSGSLQLSYGIAKFSASTISAPPGATSTMSVTATLSSIQWASDGS